MKKLLDIYDYIFYRVYTCFFSTRIIRGTDYEKALSSISILIILTFVPLLMLTIPLLRGFDISFTRYSIVYFCIFLIIFILSRPIHNRYLKPKIQKNNYQLFRERWGDEPLQQHKIRGWLVVALVFNNIIVIPILTIILGHFNII